MLRSFLMATIGWNPILYSKRTSGNGIDIRLVPTLDGVTQESGLNLGIPKAHIFTEMVFSAAYTTGITTIKQLDFYLSTSTGGIGTKIGSSNSASGSHAAFNFYADATGLGIVNNAIASGEFYGFRVHQTKSGAGADTFAATIANPACFYLSPSEVDTGVPFREAAEFLGADVINDTVFWKDSSVTTTIFSGSGLSLPSLPTGTDFTIYVDFYLSQIGNAPDGTDVVFVHNSVSETPTSILDPSRLWSISSPGSAYVNGKAGLTSVQPMQEIGSNRYVLRFRANGSGPGAFLYEIFKRQESDGTLVKAAVPRRSGETAPFNLTTPLKIAYGNPLTTSGPRWMTGSGGNIAFFSRALSDEEIDGLTSYETFVAGTPAEFTTTPATADATMQDATFSFVPADPNAVYNAAAATANAMAGDARVVGSVEVDADVAGATAAMGNAGVRLVNGTRTNHRGLNAWNFSPYTSAWFNATTSTAFYGGNGTYYVEVPWAAAQTAATGKILAAMNLRMKRGTHQTGDVATVSMKSATRNVDGTYTTGSKVFLAPTSFQSGDQGAATGVIPQGNQYVAVVLSHTVATQVASAWDNPTEGTIGTDATSYFTSIAIEPTSVTSVASPALADGVMSNADVDVQTSVSVGAIAASASAEMLNGIFPDANTKGDLMTATGLMGAAWFRSGRRVTVGAFQATAEALTIESVTSDRNVIVAAGVAEGDGGTILDPLEVNRDAVDPYFLRLTGRELDGTSIPTRGVDGGHLWFRFNERSGPEVTAWNALTGLPGSSAPLEGNFRRGVPGPNGRRATHIDGAMMTLARREYMDGSAGSIEFTVRIAPNHTGRMDLFNGVSDNWYDASSTGNKKHIHVSVRDGHVYAAGAIGGTSARRIDDGKFHHIVFTGTTFYIDGVRDRTFRFHENVWDAQYAPEMKFRYKNASVGYPERLFGMDTGYPFKGDILEVVHRSLNLSASQVMDLYLDMFGFKATRAGIVGAAVGAMGDAKVESNMKRMLVLSFGPYVNNPFAGQITKNNIFGVLVDEARPKRQTDMFLHGQDGKYGIGNYMMTWQNVNYTFPGDANWELRRDRGQDVNLNRTQPFRNMFNGRDRIIDIFQDVRLDDFDVIFVQGYDNPALNTQAERDHYEPFFRNLNRALVEGKKLWITDPYLAYDLGWVTEVDKVPVLRNYGNDVRSFDVHPRGRGLAPRPADGSMPVLPKGLPQGSAWGLYNLFRWDYHHNNGYRVVNEIDGLTNLPTWEMEELYIRDRTVMLPDGGDWEQRGYKLVNRSGHDFEWSRTMDRVNKTYEMEEPSTGVGLRAGDEFYDYAWYEYGWEWFKYGGSNSTKDDRARLHRANETWAIPMGHLKVGTPVTTFRSTLHDDFGNEVANPYRNHIRNAVVRPGDRLPDGRKVQGYAMMEFAMRPDHWFLTGQGVKKQLVPPPAYYDDVDVIMPDRSRDADETARSFEWDYFTEPGRWMYGGNAGFITNTQYTISYGAAGGNAAPTFTAVTTSLPLAEKRGEGHPTVTLPHQNWVSRGLSWLFTLDRVESEYSNVAVQAATATGRITGAQIDTEFDNEVSVGAAQATATIVAPEEAQVKDTKVMAFAATGRGMMNGLAGGYKAEVADGFGTMPQNVLRPLDIEEVLFFTVTMNQKTINLRMEEN